MYLSKSLRKFFYLSGMTTKTVYFPRKGTVTPYPDGTRFTMPNGQLATIVRECPCTDMHQHYEVRIDGAATVSVLGHGDITEGVARAMMFNI